METESKTYKITMRTTDENRMYLQEISWRNKTSVTQYINDLIEADKAKHPEWKETIDVLNK